MLVHRTWFKVLFNPLLRALQFWSSKPYVIVSKCEVSGGKIVKVVGYGFQRTPRP